MAFTMKKAILGCVILLVFLNYFRGGEELVEGKVKPKKKGITELLNNCKEINKAEVRYAKKIYGKNILWM
jgi:hypothetical protein